MVTIDRCCPWLDRTGRVSWPKAAILTAAFGPAAALGEAVWHGVVDHWPTAEILAADLSLDDGPGAGMVILAVGISIAGSRGSRLAVERARAAPATSARPALPQA